MEVVPVAQYESDVSDEEVVGEDDGINENKRSQKKKSKFWIIKDAFDRADEAEVSVGNQWSNNALEATNKTIKDDGTFRERHVVSRFLTISSNIILNWSIERDPSLTNARIFATEPAISLQLWTSSYQWAKSTKDVICILNGSSKIYYIPARDLKSITQAELIKI
ncbi:unnamed protein product [Rotaria sp. Silwood1]|nr:unnamed protein product [Rotaria sp. Silwood1]